MEHNPWYDESLGQSHIDPNAALHAAQLHALQVQETDRLRQLDLQAHQGFTGLQAVSDQVAPHPHHQGPGWGTVAAIGTLAYLAARNGQQAPAQPVQQRSGLKPVPGLGGWALLAAIVHFLVFIAWYGNAINGDQYFWLMALVIGLAVWVPAMLIGRAHRARNLRYNARVTKLN